jgi:hypothetical protein
MHRRFPSASGSSAAGQEAVSSAATSGAGSLPSVARATDGGRRVGRWVGAAALVLTPLLGFASACLDRPIGSPPPITTNIFVDQITQTSVDKIDLLFMIDNSISMSDKQEILQLAVPDLVQRLVNPICVDSEGTQYPPPPLRAIRVTSPIASTWRT